MADSSPKKTKERRTKIANVPIAITPEGFWCCPSPVLLQKTLKSHQISSKRYKQPTPPLSPPPPPSPPLSKLSETKSQTNVPDRKLRPTSLKSMLVSDDEMSSSPDTMSPPSIFDKALKSKLDSPQSNVVPIEFGDPKTSDLVLVLCGKQGYSVRISVHRNVVVEHSSLFADKLARKTPVSCIQIGNCVDVEIYVEAVGLMYCKEMKQRLIKQNVKHVLRILKVAQSLGFKRCIQICLEYLEAVPWIGEEEEKVVSSILGLGNNSNEVGLVLKRVSLESSNCPSDTLVHIIQLVLKSNDERGRREMKSIVLKLLNESNLHEKSTTDILNENLYKSCRNCLEALLILFKQASDPALTNNSMDGKSPMVRQIALEADNLLWLVELLSERQLADDFVAMWASQSELALLHPKLSIVSRHIVSCITARLFVGIGRGEMLPLRRVKKLLLEMWLQPLIDDYCWLRHGCRSFDGKLVEEGIGQTVLTLPLEDQQSVLLSWLDTFLKIGDSCPNLQKAFEIWWRRAFVRPHLEQH